MLVCEVGITSDERPLRGFFSCV